jgi:lipoate-protein ligase A
MIAVPIERTNPPDSAFLSRKAIKVHNVHHFPFPIKSVQPMKLLDQSFQKPAENLACEEFLLDSAEQGIGGEVLRFWESPVHFVVLGYSRPAGEDVFLDACAHDAIDVQRRYSGGGTVLQGPGCLNYALILKITPGSPLSSITDTTRFVLERNVRALEPLSRTTITRSGESDLTGDGLKFSGNAQRRRGGYVLFHGTILLNLDAALVERYLRIPTKQPAYRRQRGHAGFITNLPLDPPAVKKALASAWKATEQHPAVTSEELRGLVEARYNRTEWKFRA